MFRHSSPLLSAVLASAAIVIGCRPPTDSTDSAAVPPPASAYIMKLAALPGDDSTLFAATNGGGLYRSENRGDLWTDISPHPDLRYYNIVVFDPGKPSQLYTGGRESGLWQSTDQGNSWSLLAFPETSILSLVIDPTDADRLYVLTPNGVHRNLDGGQGSWTHVFDYPQFVEDKEVPWPNPEWPKNFGRFQHLTLDPREPDTLFVGGRWESGYHRSDDGGDTWRHETLGPMFRRADRIVPDPVTPGLLYAETHHQGMFKSYNNGRSWVSASRGIAPQKRTAHYGAVLISGSAFDPNNPHIIYAGSDYSNWKTTDAGATWHEVGQSLTCEFARSFLVTQSVIYAGTNVGIYRSFDDGATWTSANRGLPTREIIATAEGNVDDERFEFAITAGRPAVYRRSLDDANDWASVSWLLYENASAIRFEANTETVIITTPKGEYQSTDAGLRWNVPPTVYTPKPLETITSPPGVSGAVSVAIQGAVVPDDDPIDSWYQRPPYIAFAVVSPGYPRDGSSPLWTGHWTSKLSGGLDLPPSILESSEDLILRTEVRDFQYGTRIGQAPLTPIQPIIITVGL
ncbi:hypothetical protein N9Z12_04610 [Opitutaceae bacterium]|nr:hypothetical protein [Opitutaceae bacterium]